jgi:hypothetical protein
LSVPCVKHNWVQECVNQVHIFTFKHSYPLFKLSQVTRHTSPATFTFQEQLVDHVPFMLPAGESTLDPSKIYAWWVSF